MQLGLPVRGRRKAHGVRRHWIFKGRCTMMVLRAIHRAFRIVLRRMNHEVLSLECIAVCATSNKEGAIGCGLFADDYGSTHRSKSFFLSHATSGLVASKTSLNCKTDAISLAIKVFMTRVNALLLFEVTERQVRANQLQSGGSTHGSL